MPHLRATYGLMAAKGKSAFGVAAPKKPIVLLMPKARDEISGIGAPGILPLPVCAPPQGPRAAPDRSLANDQRFFGDTRAFPFA